MEEQTDIGMDTVMAAAWRRRDRFYSYATIVLLVFVVPTLLINGFVRWLAPLDVFVFVQPPLYLEIWLLPDGLIVLLAAVLLLLASAAVVDLTLRPRPGNFGRNITTAMAKAFRCLPALLGSMVQFGLIFAVFFMVMRWPKSYSLTFVVNLIGSIYLCRLIARFGLFIPVCVAEKPSMFLALRRSADLTRGQRGKVFLLQLIFAAITLAISSLVFLLGQKTNAPIAKEAAIAMGGTLQTLYNVIHAPWIWCSTTLGLIGWNVASAMLYRRLRALKAISHAAVGLNQGR